MILESLCVSKSRLWSDVCKIERKHNLRTYDGVGNLLLADNSEEGLSIKTSAFAKMLSQNREVMATKERTTIPKG